LVKINLKKIKFRTKPKPENKEPEIKDKNKKTNEHKKAKKERKILKTKKQKENKNTEKRDDPYKDQLSKIDRLLGEKNTKGDKNTQKINIFKKKEQKEQIKAPEKIPKKNIVKKPNEEDIEVLEEKLGFGWKGLGSRRIYYNTKRKENIYELIEPELTREQIDQKNKLIHLFRVHADIDVFDMDEPEKIRYLYKSLQKIIEDNRLEIDNISEDKIFYYIFREFIGYGKIDIMMRDEVIEDISCDGTSIPIFIYHKQLENIKSNLIFHDPDELDSFVIKLAQMCGKQISIYEPVVDGKLADGSRLQTTLAKTITKSSTFTIRRFREDPLTPVDLVDNNTMSLEMAAYFWLAVEHGASVLFCGGTASGKTTMLNALSLFLPSTFKIVSVEDTREINLPHENWVAGTTRTGFSQVEKNKSAKDIDMFDLIRVALRQRPKAIIVGEVRGREAYSLFQAMTTGHLSYSTVHASDMHSLIQRLESPPIEIPRSLLTSLDMVVFLNNLTIKGEPVRRITNVTEIIKLDAETNRLVTMTPFYWISELDDKFKNSGGSKLMQKIQLQNGWNDKALKKEIETRIKILEWMIKNNLRNYTQVGRIVSDFSKDPKSVLAQVEGK